MFKELMQEIEYAKTSLSPRELLYQTHGKIIMARKLGALSLEEYLNLEHECVAKGINNSKYF